jgi:hypothetical protein
MKFAVAAGDAFADQAYGCCIPNGSGGSTMKAHSRIRTTVTVGVNGIGGAIFCPSPWNDIVQVFNTPSTYNPSYLDINAAGMKILNCSTLPFSTQTSATLFGRVVAIGARLTYVGALSTRNGVVDIFSSVSHDSLGTPGNTTRISVPDFINKPETYHSLVDGRTYYLGSVASQTLEWDFPHPYNVFGNMSPPTVANGVITSVANNDLRKFYPWTAGNVACVDSTGTSLLGMASPPQLGFLISGTSGDKYELEYIVHVEYSGSVSDYAATPNQIAEDALTTIPDIVTESVITAASRNTDYTSTYASILKNRLLDSVTDVSHAMAAGALQALAAGIVPRVYSNALSV